MKGLFNFKTLTMTLIAALGLALAAPAMATGSGGGGVNSSAGASAKSEAVVNGGDSFSWGGSVGAAECAEAIQFLGILGHSTTNKVCLLAKTTAMNCKAGYLTKGECRALALKVLEMQDITLAAPPQPMMVQKDEYVADGKYGSATMNFVAQPRQLQPAKFRFNGKDYRITDQAVLAKWYACELVNFAGIGRVVGPHCSN